MLLTIIRGAKSFNDFRTIDGTKYATFYEACMTFGLVADNSEWDDALLRLLLGQLGLNYRVCSTLCLCIIK